MNKGIAIGIIVAIVIVAGVLASPLFYDTTVDEPLPVALDKIQPGLTVSQFTEMDDAPRAELVEKMSDSLKQRIMDDAKKSSSVVSESMDSTNNILLSGTFAGLAGHSAQGIAKIITVGDDTFLRFEDFEVTNGPDLRVYITPNGDVKDGIHLEKLKGSKGNQNYLLENLDFTQNNIVVIYCQPFGAYFASAELT